MISLYPLDYRRIVGMISLYPLYYRRIVGMVSLYPLYYRRIVGITCTYVLTVFNNYFNVRRSYFKVQTRTNLTDAPSFKTATFELTNQLQ